MLEHTRKSPVLPKRTVIVGASGFVGRAIARNLEARGSAVKRIGRGEVNLLADDAAARLAAHIRVDDAVVLVSAIAPVKNATMLADNVKMIAAMAEAITQSPPSYLLNIGSDAVFADFDRPITETDARAPGALHGIMHLTRELMFGDAATCLFATLRPTLIYGADDPHNGYGPNQFRRKAEAGEPICLFGQGEEQRDHVWVEDVAELAIRMLMQHSVGSLNAATGELITFSDIAHEISRLHGPVDVQATERTGPMPHNGYRAFDISAIARAFPDMIMTSPRDGFKKVADGA